MNILWFTWKDRLHPLAGGAEVVNEELAKRLVAEGHTVTFVVGGFRNGVPDQRRDGFRIIRVGSRFTCYVAAWRYYRRHHEELAADLVIDECNTMPFFAGWYTKRPTVLFFHMLCRRIWFYELPQPFSTIGWLLEPVYLRLLRRAPAVVVSESTRQDVLRLGFSREVVHVISQGIEYAPVADLQQQKKYDRPTVLSLGAMRSMKRTLDQIHAFEIAKKTLPELQLMIAGSASGRYGRQVQAAIKNSHFAYDIFFRGHVSAEEKLELMRRSHAILVTSVKEGWGLIVTEAASQGTPALVYNVDGLRDSVRNGQTGLMTLRNTPMELAIQMVNLFSDHARYDQLRRNAWEWSQTLTFDRSYADFRAVILASLDQPAQSGAQNITNEPTV